MFWFSLVKSPGSKQAQLKFLQVRAHPGWGTTRKVIIRKVLNVLNSTNTIQSGPDGLPQALVPREHSSGQSGQVRLGWVRLGLGGVLGFSNSRTSLERTFLVAPGHLKLELSSGLKQLDSFHLYNEPIQGLAMKTKFCLSSARPVFRLNSLKTCCGIFLGLY